jgi:hypothetical protein
MRSVSAIALALMCAAPVCVAHAGSDKAAPQFDAARQCDQFSQAERHDCVSAMATDSAVALRLAEARAAGMIDNWFESAKVKKLANTSLKASSQAFGAYRQAKCAFAGALRGGAIGNAHEISRLACIADTNAQRALELRHDTDALPPD